MRTLALGVFLALAQAQTPETRFVVFPADTNHNGTLFGGKVLSEMDRMAGITTRLFLDQPASKARDAVTVGVSKVRFLKPGHVKDLVVVSGLVTGAGEKSVTVSVKVERVTAGGRELLADAEFTFVAYDFKEKKSVAHGLTLEK